MLAGGEGERGVGGDEWGGGEVEGIGIGGEGGEVRVHDGLEELSRIG